MKALLTHLFINIALFSSVIAESPVPENQEIDRPGRGLFWAANLPGGSYTVALERITSISRHKYILDGAVIVDEVTVDTDGQALARFYYLSSVTDEAPTAAAKILSNGIDRIQDLAKKQDITLQDMVMKKYPVTTHAKSIEFRILSKPRLDMLFESVNMSWKRKDGRVFTAQ